MEKNEVKNLQATAFKAGISVADVSAILAKWGAPVLKLVIDGLNEGFTMTFLNEILSTLGPLFLTQAVNARQLARKVAAVVKDHPSADPDHWNKLHAPKQAKQECCDKDYTKYCVQGPGNVGQQACDGSPDKCCAEKCADDAALAPFREQVRKMLNRQRPNPAFFSAPIVVAHDADAADTTTTNPLTPIILNLIIQMLQTQGPAIAQAVVTWLIQVLQDQTTQTNLQLAIAQALAKK